ADQPITLRGVGQTIGELLNQVLQPLRLEVVDEGQGFRLSRLGAQREKQATYRVDDLLPTGARDATPMVELLATLLPELPARIDADGASLQVSGPAAAHMKVAILCERLRKARKLGPRSRYPEPLLQVKPSLATLDTVLQRTTTFSFVEFTPLAEIVDHWERTTGVTILVDWASLADNDLRPSTTLACSVNDRPWGEALDSTLAELNLAWRAVDPSTLQITTKPAAKAMQTIEFYPVATPEDASRFQRELATLGAANTVYDRPSQTVLVRGTITTHRHAWQIASELAE
ncbi:MAG: hypothetical protein AAGF31_11715, partial [Planctomycetota bacterium]